MNSRFAFGDRDAAALCADLDFASVSKARSAMRFEGSLSLLVKRRRIQESMDEASMWHFIHQSSHLPQAEAGAGLCSSPGKRTKDALSFG